MTGTTYQHMQKAPLCLLVYVLAVTPLVLGWVLKDEPPIRCAIAHGAEGTARLRFEDEIIEMMPGDSVNIPAHKKHRVEWTTPDEPTIWLAVFYE